MNTTLISKKDRWKRLKLFWQGQSHPFSTLIEDKRPVSTLLGREHQPISDMIPYGHIPVALTKGVCLKFFLTPTNDEIYGIRLKLGTYCRTNHCHIYLQLGQFIQYFSADKLVDNALTDIIFSTPHSCRSGQTLEMMIYSEDATIEDNIAVWCNHTYPLFVRQLQLNHLRFPKVESPCVSIVIPVFNKVLYTYNCLLTLQNCDQNISQEVIIVNNASTDETVQLLAQLRDSAKIINNKDNQGFVNACRQGAEIAQGDFIVFLNNDTQVTPGWLSQMLKIMEEQPLVGITGSKLVYPNGYLQEAGGIIFNDANGCNYGRFQDPAEARFNQSRPVDYCSGASLMIRKVLWKQLGGFDPRFAPAYYEDTDLCFAVRQAGYQVFYCHDSEVIHHEGITAGTDLQKGYKAYQAINRRKFQAKWWDVLATHLPPQTPPEVAAFRLTAQSSHNFRIPTHKILATHFLAQGWAPNFWSYLNLRKVDAELELIESSGFNTVIILVPWVGFQTQINPITYYEEYFTLFEQLFEKLEIRQLKIILRLGYVHDNGPLSMPHGFLRSVTLAADRWLMIAWCDYLDKLWTIAKKYSCFLGGFISWEDFFLMDLTHGSLEQRLEFAEKTGYQDYLRQHYSLVEISTRYQSVFEHYEQIPIPLFKTLGIHLFCEFWDDLLINKIFKHSKNHFPLLSMEVRTDCEPEGNTGLHIGHEKTFDIAPDVHLTTIYYAPAWGAPNDGNLESAQSVLERMRFMFNHIRAKTINAIFIDQFNFIDNTPGFEKHTRIIPEELPHFFAGVVSILQQNTIGYGLWTLKDVPANAMRNGLFERNYPCWYITSGEIIFDEAYQQHVVSLKSGGCLSQTITNCAGVPLVADKFFNLDFKIKNRQYHTGKITVSWSNQQTMIEQKQLEISGQEWQSIHLAGIPFKLGDTFKLDNQGEEILITDFYFYQILQENGIIDETGRPKAFYHDFVRLNQKLATSNLSPPSFLSQQDLVAQNFDGLFPDLWMGKAILGIIATPLSSEPGRFMVKIHVPEEWKDYTNQLTIILHHQQWHHAIQPGYNEITLDISEKIADKMVFFKLEAQQVFFPHQYHPDSQDNRELSMQLLGLGFI